MTKALAMGADAVAIASAALMAAACQQYRICGTGMCPVGVATQDEKLRSRFKEDAAAQRVANFLRVSLEEIKTICQDLQGMTTFTTWMRMIYARSAGRYRSLPIYAMLKGGQEQYAP